MDAPRRLPFKMNDIFKEELDNILKNNIIEKVNESFKFLYSVICVEKPNKSSRMCPDHRFPNKVIHFKV